MRSEEDDMKPVETEERSDAQNTEEQSDAQNTEELKDAQNTEEQRNEVQNDAPVVTPQVDDLGRAYATGKRKNAIARVWLKSGKGRIQVNRSSVYFSRATLRMLIEQPFKVVDRAGWYDVMCTVKGGGLSGQSQAVRHGIAKALSLYDPNLRVQLKEASLLTRDSRIVERKKYGRRKARRRFQFSKR